MSCSLLFNVASTKRMQLNLRFTLQICSLLFPHSNYFYISCMHLYLVWQVIQKYYRVEPISHAVTIVKIITHRSSNEA